MMTTWRRKTQGSGQLADLASGFVYRLNMRYRYLNPPLKGAIYSSFENMRRAIWFLICKAIMFVFIYLSKKS